MYYAGCILAAYWIPLRVGFKYSSLDQYVSEPLCRQGIAHKD